MSIPVVLLILFIFSPDLAIICGALVLSFMFPIIPISIIMLLLTLSAFGAVFDYIDETNAVKRISLIIKKCFFLNIDKKQASFKQILMLIAWWIFISYLFFFLFFFILFL